MIELSRTPRAEVIVLNRPEKANALEVEDLRQLDAILERLLNESDPKVVVLRGAEHHFCAGIDLGVLNRLRDGITLEELEQLQRGVARLATLDLPTIAAIEGACIGAGLEIALSCDIRVATRDARLSLPEARFGIVADLGGLLLLNDVVGAARAAELALCCRTLTGEEARAIGLVHEVVSEPAALEERIDALLDELARAPLDALRATKRLLVAERHDRLGRHLRDAAHANVTLLSRQALTGT